MRLFIAIDFSNEIKSEIKRIQGRLKDFSIGGNFTAERNFHITLAFLGETSAGRIRLIEDSMRDAASHTAPFTLILKGAGTFDGHGDGETWWIGICRSYQLEILRNALAERLEKAGFMLEKRTFAPHLTIGREVRMSSGFNAVEFSGTTGIIEVQAANISLMKSERLDGRLLYTVIRKIRLGVARSGNEAY